MIYFDIFLLIETWLTLKDAIVCSFNFDIIRNDRTRRDGGVVFFLNSLKVKKIISKNNINFEYICLDVIKKKVRFLCL